MEYESPAQQDYEDLLGIYSDVYKETFGMRPHGDLSKQFSSAQEISDEITMLLQQGQDKVEMQQHQQGIDDMQFQQDSEVADLAADPDELENLPKISGMGRRSTLESFIRETLLELLIKEVLLKEEVFGAQAFVYHGSNTDPKKMKEILVNNTFDPGHEGGSLYGNGLYAVYEKQQQTNTFQGRYGFFIYKLKVNLHGFIIFDSDICQKVYGKVMTPIEQLDMLGLQHITQRVQDAIWSENHDTILQILNGLLAEDDPTGIFTSDEAQSISHILSKYVKGIVFTGRQDGKVAVIYDTSGVVPVSWSKSVTNSSATRKFKSFDKETIRPALVRSAMDEIEPGRFNQ